jgi:arylsulfatase A-like enzyme
MIRFQRVMAVFMTCATVASGLTSALAQEYKPSIIVIVADDLGYSDLGYLGGKDVPTPNIDKLAAEGVRFSSGYVSGPYCSPTRAGLVTGKYQQRFGHEFNPGPAPNAADIGLSVKETTIANRLKNAGYATGLVGKWHLGSAEKFRPPQRGYDEFFGFLGGAHPYFSEDGQQPIYRGNEEVKEPEYLTDAFTREAVSFIDRHKDKPFFLQLTYNAVHTPMHAKPEHKTKFASIADETRRNYAGMLFSMDEGIGKVVEALQKAGVRENTLIAFISDNGGPPVNGSSNGALRGQKATTWEGGIRVPFILNWPGQLKASEYHQPVIQLDLLPTILAAIGSPATPEEKLDGVNLLPYVKGEVETAPHESLYWRFGQQTAIRHGDWKLVKANGIDKPALFNLKDDIGEQNDKSFSEPELVVKLQKIWDEWNSTLVEPAWKPAAQQKGGQGKGKGKNRKQ